MAKITVNEISQNYTFNIGDNAYAIVALPITAAWGPGFDHEQKWSTVTGGAGYEYTEEDLENTRWLHFPATREGMEDFVRTFRGPVSDYKARQDFSYQQALTYLSAGYDVLVCRVGSAFGGVATSDYTIFQVTEENYDALPSELQAKYSGIVSDPNPEWYPCDGRTADNEGSVLPSFSGSTIKTGDLYFKQVAGGTESGTVYAASVPQSGEPSWCPLGPYEGSPFLIVAKYKGSFGNQIRCSLKLSNSINNYSYAICTLIVSVVDTSGVSTAVENIQFVLGNAPQGYEDLPSLNEVESSYVSVYEHYSNTAGRLLPAMFAEIPAISLSGGRDTWRTNRDTADKGVLQGTIRQRFGASTTTPGSATSMEGRYETAVLAGGGNTPTGDSFCAIAEREVVFMDALQVYDLLKDTLVYNHDVVVSPGWDDYDLLYLDKITYADLPSDTPNFVDVTPFHKKLMEVAYHSRCAAAYIDVPRSLPRKYVYSQEGDSFIGYAQRLSMYRPDTVAGDVNGVLFNTHSGLCAPWGQYMYVSTSKYNICNPAFEALMIQRAMILNQAAQYFWALPTNRKHNVKLGKLDYPISKKLLDVWQKLSGVGVNVITDIPDMGISLWGNSTLFEVPLATYQALANLSTRLLFNAIEDVVYKCGISITFSYNNAQAYSKFYAGVTPLLDTMKNVGAIDGYYVKVAADINGLDQVNANSVVGKIYLVINGVINDVTVDLIAMPTGTDLSQFAD